jgi:hypothetical protein
MKIQKILFLVSILSMAHLVDAQNERLNWSISYTYGISIPHFTSDQSDLNAELKNNSQIGRCQEAVVSGGFMANEKLLLTLGVGYGSYNYKNDSLDIEVVSSIAQKIDGLVVPFQLKYSFSERGWYAGVGARYFKGIKENTSYLLLNNNQRQTTIVDSYLSGLGYQLQVGKQFKADEKHVIGIQCNGNYYPNLQQEANSTFGFLNISMGVDLTF